jgi:hypothetical protein
VREGGSSDGRSASSVLQPRQLDVHGGEVLLKLRTKLSNKTDDFLQNLAVLTALTIERGYATVDQGKPGFRIV